jgi:hypothetical protein
MSVQPSTDQNAETAPVSKPSSGEIDTDSHVPAWAEDMEHTLKRLNREKQAKRDKQPGLYL